MSAKRQATTKLAGQPCANPACNRPIPARATHHLCWQCDRHWRKQVLPAAGFIASGDLKYVASRFIAETRPTEADTATALRLMRGTRHREGAWVDRPAYRLQPLLNGRVNTRIPHLLAGRRSTPTLRALMKSIVHWHLANQIIGTGAQYSFYLAGASFYERRSPLAPKGAEVSKVGRRTASYRLTEVDYSAIGQRCLKASSILGFNPKSRDVSDRIVSLYAEALEAGVCHGQVVLPYLSLIHI